MAYSLRRVSDGAGDEGQMSTRITPTFDMDTGKVSDIQYEENAEPKVGSAMRVGAHYARTYSAQDYWQTTIITEILEEKILTDGHKYVKFKTGNSEYVWQD